MANLDIRTCDGKIDKITFGDAAYSDDDERTDTAYFLNVSTGHADHVFIEAANGDYLAIRKADLANLVKALQKAQEIWK